MAAAASGTTFLFTDIEGSTRLWETAAGQMAAALERHDRLCRDAVDRAGGAVVKMTGDGLHAAFADAGAALAVALELQHGMAAIGAECGLPFRMRAGLHMGVAQERDGDHFGVEVNRAARIMAVAHGGQILLSPAVVHASAERLPPRADVKSLGRVRLRDLSDPLELWQLVHPALPAEFPPLRSLDATPNNLPHERTSFVGRQAEIERLRALLREQRALTLTGAGGCGKTRLALHVAAEALESFPDGVWLVELAPLSAPGLLPQAVATVLGLKERADVPVMEALEAHIGQRRMLLLLDNAEHLRDACAALAAALLAHCPSLTLLVTSRERLRLPQERTLRVPSLTMPDANAPVSMESLAGCESATLFADRARHVAPRFEITPQCAQAVASICRRLDGIPLAIELAAARVRSMAVEDIDRRLDQRFRLVTGGAVSAPRRQQTLRALIDWSYDLLGDGEKALLCRASSFAGSFSLQAAEAVCSGDGIEAWEVLDLLTSLADKNLVVVEERRNETRYRLLESVRQYADERLAQQGATRRWHDRHFEHFLALALEAHREERGAQQETWLQRLDDEHDNLRAALDRAPLRADPDDGLRLGAALRWFWFVRTHWSEGSAWLGTLLANEPSRQSPEARANALQARGTLAWAHGDHAAARSSHEEELGLWRALGRKRAISGALTGLANIAMTQGEYDPAQALYEESLAIDREIGHPPGTATTLMNLANILYHKGDYEASEALARESVAIRREGSDKWGTAAALVALANAVREQERYEEAAALYDESLALWIQLKDGFGIGAVQLNLGEVAYARGDFATARSRLAEALALLRERGIRRGVAVAHYDLGNVALREGDVALARAQHQEAAAIRRELADQHGIADSVIALACVALREGAPQRAARLWGAARRWHEESGAKLAPYERAWHEGDMVQARALAGEDAFAAAWREGRALSLDDALASALSRQPDA